MAVVAKRPVRAKGRRFEFESDVGPVREQIAREGDDKQPK
ncbi:hypothetical protein C791_5499 [Amycolatopsis azurea DSM 43854]|uniref:Uncharacterized protein n=1 Tax=Amycolatopsis azurea DSM 43854 TaxID=1238180 RepID=M2QG05_9PSEU|nr:hypothetical protein C791_5499 [Amycolatopsis azurea DSM 43854]